MKLITLLALCIATVKCSSASQQESPPTKQDAPTPQPTSPTPTPPTSPATDKQDALNIDRLRKRGRALLKTCTGKAPVYPEDVRFEREIKQMRGMVKRNAAEERRCGKKWHDSMPPRLIKAYQHYLEWQDSWLGKLMGKMKAQSCDSIKKISEPPPYQKIMKKDGMGEQKGQMRVRRVVRRYRVYRSGGGGGSASYSSGSGSSSSGSSSSSSSGRSNF